VKTRNPELKFLIIGAGSIGSRHLGNLESLGFNDLLVFDTSHENRRRACQEFNAQPFESLDEALRLDVDVAIIATPTHLHLPLALEVAQAGCHIFIEKPLSHSLEGVGELVQIVNQYNLVTMVGCNMRFHHGPREIKRLLDQNAIGRIISASLDAGQYMPDWHPNLDYRKRYSANRSMGGGVVLDGIHEIDYARWLFGDVKEVFSHGGKFSSLELDVEDTANILMTFASGFSVMLHIDYIQRYYSRTCKVIGEEGTIYWDITTNPQVRWYSSRTNNWNSIEVPNDYNINDMYVEEFKYFIDCVKKGENTISDISDAVYVTNLALAIKQSIRSGRKVKIQYES